MSDDGTTASGESRLDAIATHWTLVRKAHEANRPQDATTARRALVLRYGRAIRRYLGGMVKNTSDADELAQDAILRLMAGDFSGADPNRGRFRDLLKTAIRNMAHNHWAKANRRRGVDLDLSMLGAEAGPADAEWDAAWRQTVLDHAWSALKEHERENPGSLPFTVLKLRTDHPDADSEELAAKIAAKSGTTIRADACRQMLRRARMRFAELLLQEVAGGLSDPSKERLAEELAALGLLEYVRDFLPEK